MSETLQTSEGRGAAPQTYALLWRNKYLTCHARTIEEMVEALLRAAAALREMDRAGVRLEGDVEEDHALLVTADPAVAARFNFTPAETAR